MKILELNIVQVMAWCSKADSTKSSMELIWTNHHWGFWNLPEGNFTGNAQDMYPWYGFTLKIIYREQPHLPEAKELTHWGWVTHICISKLTIISSDNGLSSDRHRAIIWTNAGILLIGPLGTSFSEILIKIQLPVIYTVSLRVDVYCFDL